MILWDLPVWWVWGSLFVLGATIGSFLNVCVYRLPRHEDIWNAWKGVTHPPSSCPYCTRRILARDNIPILGWLWLRGRCRNCRHRISARYPIVEALNGLLFVGLYSAMVPVGFTRQIADSCLASPVSPLPLAGHHQTIVLQLHWQYLYYLVFVEALLVASLIDFDLQIIPDSVTVPAMVVGLLGSLAGSMYLMPVWIQNPSLVTLFWGITAPPDAVPPWWTEVFIPAWCLEWPRLHGFAVSLAGFLVGGGMIWFVRLVGAWVFRREAMGFGDVILMAMIGSFLGWQPTILVFFLAPICALATVAVTSIFRREREIPFGPYLSLGALLVIVGWKQLFPVAERFLTLGPYTLVLAAVLAVTLVAVLWLVQGVKWLLGIQLFDEEETQAWTSADQLAFFASQQSAQRAPAMQPPVWSGVQAGQGTLHRRRWQGPR